MKTVFLLEALVLQSKDANGSALEIDSDGRIPLHVPNLGIFSTVKSSESAIKQWIEHCSSWEDFVLGFRLTEKPLDRSISKDFGVYEFISLRTYLSNGELNCMSDCDSSCKVKFNGRAEPVKCNVNDVVVDAARDDFAYLSLVVDVPMTKEIWKRELKPGVFGDYTDDSYTTVYIGLGHEHPFSPDIFPMPWKVPDDVLKLLEEEKKLYMNGEKL